MTLSPPPSTKAADARSGVADVHGTDAATSSAGEAADDPHARMDGIGQVDGDDDLIGQLRDASRCRDDVDYAPLEVLFEGVVQWAFIDGVADGFEDQMTDAGRNATVQASLIAHVVGSNDPATIELLLATSEARAIERTTALGGEVDVVVAYGPAEFADGNTASIVAVLADDDVAFVGGCATHFTDAFLDRFGNQEAAAVQFRSMIGVVGAALVDRLASTPIDTTAPDRTDT